MIGELLELRGQTLRSLHITAIFRIRQSGIRIARDARGRSGLMHGPDMIGHQFRAGGAVQPNGERAPRVTAKPKAHRRAARRAWSPSARSCRPHRRDPKPKFSPDTIDSRAARFYRYVHRYSSQAVERPRRPPTSPWPACCINSTRSANVTPPPTVMTSSSGQWSRRRSSAFREQRTRRPPVVPTARLPHSTRTPIGQAIFG